MSNLPTKPTLPKIQPDKDEDLDDLDDVLDEFSEKTSIPKAPPPSAFPSSSKSTSTSTPFGNRPRHNTRVDAPPVSTPGTGIRHQQQQQQQQQQLQLQQHLDSAAEIDETALSEDFARELAQEMENLLKGFDVGSTKKSDGDGVDEGATLQEERDKFQAAWTAALVEQLAGNNDASPSGAGNQPGIEGGGDDKSTPNNFQWQIKQAMEKLKESESNLKSGSNTGIDSESETIQNLIKSLGDLDFQEGGGNDDANGAEIAATLETVMGQLMGKDILYEPLKDLRDNFPGFLANPPKPLDPTLRTRYESQYSYVKQIVDVFESPDFDESNLESKRKIMGLMNDMQNQGSPPPEIMGPMPPLLENGLTDDNCVIA